ncbi:MAG: hypothetical protein AAF928_01630 [Myxococcota bacterium]
MQSVPFAEIDGFALGQHAGPYPTWPLRTPLLKGGVPTGKNVRGYHLTFQFRLARDEYLLILDWDCPFEEYYEVYLLSETGAVLSHLTTPPMNPLSVGGAPTLLCSWQVVNEHKLRLLSCDAPPHLDITVRERRPWRFGSRLAAVWDDTLDRNR